MRSRPVTMNPATAPLWPWSSKSEPESDHRGEAEEAEADRDPEAEAPAEEEDAEEDDDDEADEAEEGDRDGEPAELEPLEAGADVGVRQLARDDQHRRRRGEAREDLPRPRRRSPRAS